MIKNYRTEYPNHAHQLSVSVSHHYYLTKSNLLKYQQKKLEIKLDNLNNAVRVHIVHYVIRDHFSGLFYAELALSNNLIPLQEFLFRAWANEKDYSFYGIPEMLTIPDTVERKFSGIKERVASLGINLLKVTSGFQSGVRDIKTIEEYMKGYDGYQFDKAIIEMSSLFRFLNQQKSRNGTDTKFELWHKYIKSICVPKVEWLDELNAAR